MASKNENINNQEEDIEYVEVIPLPEPIKELKPVESSIEDTRGRLAIIFVIGFFVVLLVGLVIALLSAEDKVGSSKEILLTISGILSGPLGFIIGYYFRSQEEK